MWRNVYVIYSHNVYVNLSPQYDLIYIEIFGVCETYRGEHKSV